MTQAPQIPQTPSPLDRIEAAFLDVLDAAERARATASSAAQDAVRYADAALAMAELVPAHQRAQYTARLAALKGIAPISEKGGPLYDNVVHLFRQTDKREWKINEVQRTLSARGFDADAKSIADVLGYLERSGRITRIARGCYRVDGGGGFVTAAELPAGEYGQTRTTEHDW